MASMKKILLAAAVVFIGAVVFGQRWSHSAGLSFNPAYYSVEVKGEGEKAAFVPQISARYYGEMDNGFCLTGTVGAGLLVSRDFKLATENNVATGPSLGLSFGAGYAFHFGDRWTLAALGSLSFDWMQVRKRKDISTTLSYGRVTSSWTQKENLFLFGIGAEALGIFRFTKHLSMWGSLAIRFFDAGTLERSGDNQGKSYDASLEVRGNVSVTPSIGAAWTF
ncbi:MAG: hypothetical protein IK094_00530 [Treponema sp.]|nr:hypothetical protein [Treponema sp.]